jgi:sugar lactone lactonase YvrE
VLQVYLAEPTPEGSYQLTTEEPLLYVTPGRPLGLMFDAEGTLYVASSPLGLMKVVAPGTPEQKLVVGTAIVSADSPLAPNTPVEFADGIDIASDGTVYFSHASDVTAYR